MFSGEQSHQLDAKNRIRIPAKFKIDPNEKLVFCKGASQCILVLPKSTFENMATQFSSISIFDAEGQEALMEFMSAFYSVEEDGQGRILLPQALKDYAGIDKNIVTVGVFNRLEIWSEEILTEKRKAKSFASQMDILNSRIK